MEDSIIRKEQEGMLKENKKRILLLEAFHGGSHKQMVDYLKEVILRNGHAYHSIEMSDKKWHWRMRTSSLHFAQCLRNEQLNGEAGHKNFDTVFVSAVLNLAELVGLSDVVRNSRKILYFHENQLVYPVRKQQDRDFQHGYNQIISCLVADVVLFNSDFNRQSFLDNINKYMKLMPDYRPSTLKNRIEPKCHVLYYIFKGLPPVESASHKTTRKDGSHDEEPLHIVWPHRWEHDKNPQDFFDALYQLHNEKFEFKVSIVGQTYQDVPEIFAEAKQKLADVIINWGYQSLTDYHLILENADVAVSTANHEFFGVSMLECVSMGCYPLVPNRLVYPEFYPDCYLYNTKTQLYKKLKNLCKYPKASRNHQIQVDLSKFDEKKLERKYLHYLTGEG